MTVEHREPGGLPERLPELHEMRTGDGDEAPAGLGGRRPTRPSGHRCGSRRRRRADRRRPSSLSVESRRDTVLFGRCDRSATSDTPAGPPARQRSTANARSTDCTLDIEGLPAASVPECGTGPQAGTAGDSGRTIAPVTAAQDPIVSARRPPLGRNPHHQHRHVHRRRWAGAHRVAGMGDVGAVRRPRFDAGRGRVVRHPRRSPGRPRGVPGERQRPHQRRLLRRIPARLPRRAQGARPGGTHPGVRRARRRSWRRRSSPSD